MFPVATSALRRVAGIHLNSPARRGNRNSVPNRRIAHNKFRMQVRAQTTGRGSFFRLEKKRCAIRICVMIVAAMIRMSAIPDL
jgi:hypothetical protein